MSNGSDEKRKIIIDSQVAKAALRGIEAVTNRELMPYEVKALIECDEHYLAEVRRIAPRLLEDES